MHDERQMQQLRTYHNELSLFRVMSTLFSLPSLTYLLKY